MLLFSRHARSRMLERGIEDALIIETIARPDRLMAENDQYTAVKQFGKNVLLVIYTKSNGIEFVITVIFSSKLGKYLNK